MVFLIENFVDLPADQVANIWLAAHMKRKLNKKDIKKTKLGEACEQLHSDRVKKPMPLRHYGQCLMGISYIHYKQVEYLHNDCNEAFSKARLVLVRKRNVDLDPAKDRGRDITLPENKQNGNDLQLEERELLDFDLDANINLSQLYLDDDNISEVGSLLGTDSHSGAARSHLDHQALDHEITMQQNELNITSPNRSIHGRRRSSFGGISSLLMGDMDIELKFDDDDDDDADGPLDESQAQRANIDDLANLTDDESVERGRGGINHTMMQVEEPDISMLPDNVSLNGTGSVHSFAKEKEMRMAPDAMSAHSGSMIGGGSVNMDIDEGSVHSVHVQFNLDDTASVNGSVATAVLNARQEQITPPGSPSVSAAKAKTKSKKKSKKKKKKKRKKRFGSDACIEFERSELRASKIENAEFLHPAGRDSLHIWREFPLASLNFEELMNQPLSKELFGQFGENISSHFALCNSENASHPKKADDPLNGIDILREDGEVEKGRDYGSDQAVNEEEMEQGMNIDESMQEPLNELSSMNLNQLNEPQLELNIDDDNVSTLDSVCNDALPAPNDPLFDDEQPLEEPLELDEPDHHLSFDTNDENVLTQMDNDESQNESVNANANGIKPRDWSKRAKKTFAYFKRLEGSEFSFDKLMETQTKRDVVVGVFYELLVFKNSDLVDLQQEEPYGDITITKTKNFYRHAKRSQRMSQRMSGIHEHN